MTVTELRLPNPAPPREARRREVRRGLLAGLGLLLVLVGVPAALVLTVGNPLPTEPPSRAWLTTPVTATLVLQVLAAALWLAWAHFAVCVVAEWRAARRGRGMPTPVPLGGGSQLAARRLVAAVLLLAGAATLAPQTAPSAGPVAPPPAAAAVVADAAPEAEAPAAAAPAAAEKTYVVQPPAGRRYDCLWDIAERTLGDPLRYKEIFALNKDKVMSDGQRLVDADLIHPGWVLRMPADAVGAGVSSPAVAPPAAPAAPAAPGAPAAPAETGAPAAPAEGASAERVLLGGGLLAAGLLVALSARRGPYGAPADAPALGPLRLAATPGRAALLDRALRGLAATCAETGRPLPEVAVAYVDDERVTLALAAPDASAPAPWTPVSDGRGWSVLGRDLPDAGRPDAAAPYPALAGVALSGTTDVLVDLEAAPGLVALEGDPVVARDLAVSLAVELATNLWSDGVHVSLVGFGDDLTTAAPGRVTATTSLAELLPALEQEARAAAGSLQGLGARDVLAGRLVRGAARRPPRVVVLSGPPSPEDAARLSALVAEVRTPLAVVAVGTVPSARWRFVLDPAGGVDLGVLGVRADARRLPPAEYGPVLAALAEADRARTAGAAEVGALAPVSAAESVHEAAPGPRRRQDPGPAAVRVRLLGPVEVHAPGPVDPAARPLLTDVVVAAALHPQGLHEAVLRAEVWPRGVGEDVVTATLAQVEAWLGTGADGRPRLRREADGRLALGPDVSVDLEQLLERAAAPEGPGQAEALEGAVRLFAGPALSGARSGSLVVARAARDARVVGTAVAVRAAALALARGDRPHAAALLRAGLLLVPASEVLWRELLRVTGGGGEPGAAGRVAAEAYAALEEHGLRPEPETDALVRQLAPEVARTTA